MQYVYEIIHLRGQLHEIFDPRFFHQSTSPGALIHGLRQFRIWPRIRRENRQNSNRFSFVIDTAEIGFKKPLKLSVSIASQTCNDLRYWLRLRVEG
jgi:hypothetical protein